MARNVQIDNQPKQHTDRPPIRYTEREWARIEAQEREEQKKQHKLLAVLIAMIVMTAVLAVAVYVFVFASHEQELILPYEKTDTVYGIKSNLLTSDISKSFASDLCVTADANVNADQLSLTSSSAALFDLSGQNVLYGKDIFTQRPQASITKVMTALVALKYGNLDDMVTVTETALDIEYGSSVCDIKVGDRLSMKQLLYGLLIASGNDAGMMIAEHVAGSVSAFVDLMNQEARALGATSTHFTNPHGLNDPDHYTTIYDTYLIFREAMKNDVFLDIINRTNYYAEYTSGDGSPVAVTWESTNQYFLGLAQAPENVIVYGGKTGTTDEAGACLALLSKDLYGDPYLSIIFHAENKDTLYAEMNQVLSLIHK